MVPPKKEKKEYYFMTCEYYRKYECECPQIKLCWHRTSPLHLLWSVAAFHCRGRVEWLQQRPCGLQSLKYLLSDLFYKKFAEPCPQVELPESSHPEALWEMITLIQIDRLRVNGGRKGLGGQGGDS